MMRAEMYIQKSRLYIQVARTVALMNRDHSVMQGHSIPYNDIYFTRDGRNVHRLDVIILRFVLGDNRHRGKMNDETGSLAVVPGDAVLYPDLPPMLLHQSLAQV
jgi:hypothetical protein